MFNPSHTFGDEFLLAGLIDEPNASLGGTTKKPTYYTPGYPQSQKVSQATAAIPLTINRNRGNGSLPEIANSPPDSSWGAGRVSHPKIGDSSRSRMAIFEGLRICEHHTEDAELTGLGSPLAPQEVKKARQITGQRQRNKTLATTTGQQPQNWAQVQHVESGERQLGGTKSMMKGAVSQIGRRGAGVKLDVHK